MTRGDRFKSKLPKFIGQIPDFQDLFIAEDQEFTKIDKRIDELIVSSTITGFRDLESPGPFLNRLEHIFGIPNDGADTETRIARLLFKLKARNTTTRELVRSICREFGYVVKFIRKYEEYGFLLEFFNPDTFSGKVIDSIDEIKPAHLKLDYSFIFSSDLIFDTSYGNHTYSHILCNERMCGCIPNDTKVGHAIRVNLTIETESNTSKNYYGLPGIGHKTGEINGYEKEFTGEVIYQSNFESESIYQFDGGDR